MDIITLQQHDKIQSSKYKINFDLEGRELALAVGTKLMEEMGEMSDELLGFYKLQRSSKLEKYTKESLSEEMCDVLMTLFVLADVTEIDMNAVIEKRLQRPRRN